MQKECKVCLKDKNLMEFSRIGEKYLHLCKDCDAVRRNKKRVNFKKDFKINKVQCAYLAGFIDGEGYIGLAKRLRKSGKYKDRACYHSRMVITSTSLNIHQIRSNYGFGHIYKVKSKKINHKDRYDWIITSNEIRTFLPQIIKLLHIKNGHAVLLMEYLNLPRTKNEVYRNKAENIYQKLKLLNKRGVQQ
jgi:hypothetical protein